MKRQRGITAFFSQPTKRTVSERTCGSPTSSSTDCSDLSVCEHQSDVNNLEVDITDSDIDSDVGNDHLEAVPTSGSQ